MELPEVVKLPVTHSEYKVHGGKLIRVSLTVEGDRIVDIKITGDFFMHPEEAITGLESRLRGLKLNEALLQKQTEEYLKSRNVKVLGASSNDFATAILKAAGKVK